MGEKLHCNADYPHLFDFLDDMWPEFNEGYLRYFSQWLEGPEIVYKGRARILFVSTFFAPMMKDLSADFVCLAQDRFEVGLCEQHKLPYFLPTGWKKRLWEAYCNKWDCDALICDIGTWLREHRIKVVILKNDSLFLERVMIAGAREVEIPTITIQHGLFCNYSNIHGIGGKWTDHYLVWGEWVKDLFIKKNVLDADRIHILGYPRRIPKVGPGFGLCILGAMNHKYVRKLIKAYPYFTQYRPHPNENRNNVPRLALSPPMSNIYNDIATFGLFAAEMSTGLIEAALSGRAAVQIRVGDKDNLEELGGLYSIKPREIRKTFSQVLEPRKVNPYYVYHDPDPTKRFLEILSWIVS